MCKSFPCRTILAVLLVFLSSCNREDWPRPKQTSGTDLYNFRVLVEGKEYSAIDTTGGNITVFVPSGTELRNLVAKFDDNALSVTVGDVPQVSGETENNFTSYKNGQKYHLESDDGKTMDYTVRVIATKLPVVAIRTDEPGKIRDKVTWRSSKMRIGNPDGTFTEVGGTGIRGRGNWTWDKYPKNPMPLNWMARKSSWACRPTSGGSFWPSTGDSSATPSCSRPPGAPRPWDGRREAAS